MALAGLLRVRALRRHNYPVQYRDDQQKLLWKIEFIVLKDLHPADPTRHETATEYEDSSPCPISSRQVHRVHVEGAHRVVVVAGQSVLGYSQVLAEVCASLDWRHQPSCQTANVLSESKSRGSVVMDGFTYTMLWFFLSPISIECFLVIEITGDRSTDLRTQIVQLSKSGLESNGVFTCPWKAQLDLFRRHFFAFLEPSKVVLNEKRGIEFAHGDIIFRARWRDDLIQEFLWGSFPDLLDDGT